MQAFRLQSDLLEALMPLQMAFGITVEDVRIVLKKHADKIANRDERSIEVIASIIFYGLTEEEMDNIALAAMDSFADSRPESEGAHRALRKLLVRRGILDVSRRSHAESHSRRHKEKAEMMMAMSQ
jgi:hypothetical protein